MKPPRLHLLLVSDECLHGGVVVLPKLGNDGYGDHRRPHREHPTVLGFALSTGLACGSADLSPRC
jgi:hypothetical protein